MKLRTKLTVMLLALLMLLGAVNVAQAEKEGDFEYSAPNGKVVILKYTGNVDDLVVPDTLGGMPVVKIGSSAFRDCTSLTRIVIPETVTEIGSLAFYGCTNLTSITLPDSLIAIGTHAFHQCPSLASVNATCVAAQSYPWPTGVIVGAFADDFLYIPVGDAAYCLMTYSGDASVVLVPSTYNGKPVTQIDGNAFGKSVVLFITGETDYVSSNPCWRYTVNADGTLCLTGTNITSARLLLPAEACGTPVTAIGDYAFYGMSLSFVHIPDSIVTVGENPFRGCTKLTTIVVNPENTGLYVSADGALYSKADRRLVCFPAGVTANRLTIPEGVRNIGAYAMYEVQAGEIVLPDSLTDIGVSAFAGNSRLMTIALPDGVSAIPTNAFADCTSLYMVAFPANLASIGQQAFDNCDRLTEVSFPSSLTSIGQQAFYDCDGLTEVSFPSSLASIGQQAFYGCDELLFVFFSDGVQTIGAQAFADCGDLQLVYLPASITEIGTDAFTGASLLTLYVEPGSHAAAYARENMLHALYPDSDDWLGE